MIRNLFIALVLMAIIGHGAVLVWYFEFAPRQCTNSYLGHRMQEENIRADIVFAEKILMERARLNLAISENILNERAIRFYNRTNAVYIPMELLYGKDNSADNFDLDMRVR